MYKTQSPDTDRQLEEALFARYRAMTSTEKLEHIGRLGQMVNEVAMAGLRARYPDASEAENRLRLLSRSVDAETMKRVYGWDPASRGM